MSTLLERSEALIDAAGRYRNRLNSASDHHALDTAREDFSEQRTRLSTALGQIALLRARGVPVTVPTNGARLAEDLRALAGAINDDPAAVRDRRRQEEAVRGFVDAVCSEVSRALSAYVAAARGDADVGLVPSLQKIGLDDAARQLQEALETLAPFSERMPEVEADLDAIDAAGHAIRRVLEEQNAPQYARLTEFMQRAASATPFTLDQLDADLLAELKAAGAAANFMVRPIRAL